MRLNRKIAKFSYKHKVTQSVKYKQKKYARHIMCYATKECIYPLV